MKSDVCTLFEGDYHFGVSALVNSLVKHGFEGNVWAGYRGALPPWTAGMSTLDNNCFEVSKTVNINFIELKTSVHLSNYKPQFMLSLFERTTAPALWYFDPDITIFCPWSFYQRWAGYGVSLCQEIVSGTMPDDHPIRMMWKDFAATLDLHSPRKLDRYFNAGFIGLSRSNCTFLKVWNQLLDAARRNGVDSSKMTTGDRSFGFHMLDQDVMNVAAMYTECPLSTIGPEGMNFQPGGFTMFHAAGAAKPWRKRMITSALLGIPPSDADKQFLTNLNGPIRPYSPFKMSTSKACCTVAALIGRFYRRN